MCGDLFFFQWIQFIWFLIIAASGVDKKLFKALSYMTKEDLIRRITFDMSKRTLFISVYPRFCSLWIYAAPRFDPNENQDQDRRNELFRLSTFHNYPNTHVSVLRMAQAGFYYNQNNDEVICYACDLVHSNWASSDDPREVHLQRSPNCPHFQVQHPNFSNFSFGLPRENQSEERTGFNLDMRNHDNVVEERRRNTDHFESEGSHGQRESWTSVPPDFNLMQGTASPYIIDVCAALSFDQLGISRYPDYITIESRRQSFQRTDTSSPGRHRFPLQVAEAGLFYCGHLDYVRCFHCGIGLYNWDVEDDPYLEHARWSPECAFIKKKKGIAFVNKVQSIASEDSLEARLNELSFKQRGHKQSSPRILQEQLEILSKTIEQMKEEKEKCEKELEKKTKENEEWENLLICKVCRDRRVNILFLPCGHLACCNDCAPRLNVCPICRGVIREAVRTFLS